MHPINRGCDQCGDCIKRLLRNLHARKAKASDRLRAEHFPLLEVPCLFVSGTKDAFATPEELESAGAAIPSEVVYQWIPGKDHGLRGTEQQVATIVVEWLAATQPKVASSSA